jgi:hypothetical protein
LTKDATLDVRKEIAKAAAVSVGNVTKVKQIECRVHHELWEALRNGEISIHRGWLWRIQTKEQQFETLTGYRSKKGINKTIRTLISRQAPASDTVALNLENLIRQLSRLIPDERELVTVSKVKTSGKAIFISEELVRLLASIQESIPI